MGGGGGGSCLPSIRFCFEVHIIAHIRKNIYFISSSISVPFFLHQVINDRCLQRQHQQDYFIRNSIAYSMYFNYYKKEMTMKHCVLYFSCRLIKIIYSAFLRIMFNFTTLSLKSKR